LCQTKTFEEEICKLNTFGAETVINGYHVINLSDGKKLQEMKILIDEKNQQK